MVHTHRIELNIIIRRAVGVRSAVTSLNKMAANFIYTEVWDPKVDITTPIGEDSKITLHILELYDVIIIDWEFIIKEAWDEQQKEWGDENAIKDNSYV